MDPRLEGLRWRKSSRSDDAKIHNCVEVGQAAGSPVVGVRDTKNPQGPALVYSAAAFASFRRALDGGQFDLG